jgi:hypothetical protein
LILILLELKSEIVITVGICQKGDEQSGVDAVAGGVVVDLPRLVQLQKNLLDDLVRQQLASSLGDATDHIDVTHAHVTPPALVRLGDGLEDCGFVCAWVLLVDEVALLWFVGRGRL